MTAVYFVVGMNVSAIAVSGSLSTMTRMTFYAEFTGGLKRNNKHLMNAYAKNSAIGFLHGPPD